MNEDLKGICKYLLGRAKKEVKATGSFHKFYFIMNYPGKAKPVYSPLAIDFGVTEYSKLPGKIQALWDERRANIPAGAALLAVCAIHNCIYRPANFPLYPIWPAGHLVVACTVHQGNERENLVVFYSVTREGVTFYDDVLLSDRAETDMDHDMFPKNV